MQYPDDSAVLGQLLDSMHYTVQYSDEDFLFNNSTMDTKLNTLQDSRSLSTSFFESMTKNNTYSDITEYSYSKCFSVCTFVPNAPGSKRRVIHLGR